jgi:uncharacterized phage protein (TIGR02218 family)
MTFTTNESSVESGSPIELYSFGYLTSEWNYTSGDVEFYDTVTSKTYSPISVVRGNLEFGSDFSRGSLELSMQYDTPFMDLFRTAAPSGVVSMTVRKVHRLDGDTEIITVWKGRVLNVNWVGSEAQLTCQPIRASLLRFGLRRQFQFNCSHVLYGAGCAVDGTEFDVTGNVTAVSGSSVSVAGVSAFAANYFAGGYIEYTNSALITPERRMITSNPGGGNSLVLVSPPLNLVIGTSAIVHPGCDHSLTTCDAKFDNSANFGGFPHTPVNKGPFSGETIY